MIKEPAIRSYSAIRKNATMRAYFDGLEVGPSSDMLKFDARDGTDVVIEVDVPPATPFDYCFTAGPVLPKSMEGVVVFHDTRA
jgi:predicted ATP-grasp superfamily ATP-dependent carboligase